MHTATALASAPVPSTGRGTPDSNALFGNCRRYWLGYGCEVRVDAGMSLYRTGVRHARLNGVMRVGEGELPRGIDLARQQLQGRPWAWWVGPDSAPGTCEALLAAGAVEVGQAPVMVVDSGRFAGARPVNVEVELLPPGADLTEWVDAFAPAMDIPAEEVPAMLRAEHARNDPPGAMLRFAARVEGRIVAVSALYLCEGIAGIYLVATDARYRRCGYGTAVTTAAVRAGHARGARLATLQATPMGRPLYERLGFISVGEYRILVFPGQG